MGTAFELEESDFAGYIDDDTVMRATVVSVKVVEKTYKDDDGNNVKKVEFKFALQDEEGPHDGTNVWGETGTRFNSHPDCKLKNWSQAILGQELPVGFRLDTDMLAANECKVVVGLKEYKDRDGNDKQRNFVKDVWPLQGLAADEPF